MSFDEWDDWDDEPAASKQREAVSPISPAEITAITVEFRKYLIDLVHHLLDKMSVCMLNPRVHVFFGPVGLKREL